MKSNTKLTKRRSSSLNLNFDKISNGIQKELVESVSSWKLPDRIHSVEILPNDLLACGVFDGKIYILNGKTGKVISQLLGHTYEVRKVKFLKENHIISASKNIFVWNYPEKRFTHIYRGHIALITDLVLIKKNTKVASCSEDRTIIIFNLETKEDETYLLGHRGLINTLIKLNDNIIVSGSDDTQIRIWDVDKAETIKILIGHASGVNCLCKISDDLIGSCSKDHTIRIWDVKRGEAVNKLLSHRDIVTSIIYFSLNDKKLLISGTWKKIRIWDLSNFEEYKFSLKGHQGFIDDLKIFKSGDLVSVSEDTTIKIWNTSFFFGNYLGSNFKKKGVKSPKKKKSEVINVIEEEKTENKQINFKNIKLISKINAGSFGTVFKALYNQKHLIAVKKIKVNEKIFDVDSIQKEISFYQTLDHTHIVKYLGTEKKVIDFETFFYIYLEYCSEGTICGFFNKIKSMKRKVYCMQVYLKQILSGLDYLHSKGIIHRDIKPSNILINEKNIIKLTDFGCAKYMNQGKGKTRSVTMKGIDIWSLGVTIIKLLIGSVWDYLHFQDEIQLIVHLSKLKAPPPISNEISNKNLRDLISHCIKLDPKERYSAEQLLEHPFFEDNIDFEGESGNVEDECCSPLPNESFSSYDTLEGIPTYKTMSDSSIE